LDAERGATCARRARHWPRKAALSAHWTSDSDKRAIVSNSTITQAVLDRGL
jgi:hypothetical protein